ncbi:MAG: rod shape-determining protein MreC [Chitinophagaceae bacterium]|nr:rod shape-determining protein MreC [Chitinophagaceae bacterium]
MRNIFLFIRRYFVFLFFLVLQFFALWMLFKYNRYHRAAFLGVANEITGRVNTQVDKVDDYFHLKEENQRVHRLNDSLMNLLRMNFNVPDTTRRLVVDSTKYDTIIKYRRYIWRVAKVVNNSVIFPKNYLQLNRGSAQGVADNMAVINSDGAVVGIVVNTSTNFSEVMSLLHTQSKVPAALKKNNMWGTVEWDTKDPRFVTLKGIPKDVEVKRGDTVVTSVYSYNFPPGLLIGRIAAVQNDQRSGFYLLKVRTAANFGSVQQVFVVENLQRDEQVQLERDTERKNEQDKRGIR